MLAVSAASTNVNVSASGEQLQHGVQGGESRREGESVAAALERRNVPLQDFPRRVARAGVLVAPTGAAQSLLDVGRRLINGGHHRARQRVGDVPRVYGACAEAAFQVFTRYLGHGGNVRAPSQPSKRPLR